MFTLWLWPSPPQWALWVLGGLGLLLFLGGYPVGASERERWLRRTNFFTGKIEATTFISKLSKNPFSSSLNFIRLLRVVITPSVVVERRKRLEAIGSNFRLFQQLFQKDNVHDSHHIVLLANSSQQCWMLHVAPVCGPCCMLLGVVTLTWNRSNF